MTPPTNRNTLLPFRASITLYMLSLPTFIRISMVHATDHLLQKFGRWRGSLQPLWDTLRVALRTCSVHELYPASTQKVNTWQKVEGGTYASLHYANRTHRQRSFYQIHGRTNQIIWPNPVDACPQKRARTSLCFGNARCRG